jgi:ankyrin repeat protein
MFAAAGKGDIDTVTALLAANVDPNTLNTAGTSAITLAAEGGHDQVLAALLSAGGDPNAAALELVVSSNRVDAVVALLAAKADPNATDSLHLASQYGYTDIITILIAAKADLNLVRSFDGTSPIYAASGSGQPAAMKLLIAAKVDVNATNCVGGSALLGAVEGNNPLGVDMLLAANAQVDKNADELDVTTPLFYAAFYGHVSITASLLAGNADPNRSRYDGMNTLHAACAWGHTAVATMLIRAGADMGAVNNEGDTPLMSAIVNHRENTLRLLLEANADPANAVELCKHSEDAVALRMVQLLQCYGADIPLNLETKMWERNCLTTSDWLCTQRTPVEVCAHIHETARLRVLLRAGGRFEAPLRPGPSNTATALLCRAANKPWSAARHFLHPPATRDSVAMLLHVAVWDGQSVRLPRECWLLVMSHICR